MIANDSSFGQYADSEWNRIENRAARALESVAGTAFIMLLIFLVMAFVVTHSRVFLVLPH